MSFYNMYKLVICLVLSKLAQGVDVSRIIMVDQSESGHFKTISEAIDSVPPNNNKWVEIRVKAGIYQEKITIPNDKQYISLVGEGSQNTVIQWLAGGGSKILDYGTFTVLANNTLVKNISFKNLYHPKVISQAPAVVVTGDKIAFYRCGFVGLQDTLTDFRGRHYFESCYIEGLIDFIWGYGQSLYQNCVINVTSRDYDERVYGAGFITAQGRINKKGPEGFVFKYCRVVGTCSAYLGRPYESYSRVVFFKSFFSHVVVPQGWNSFFIKGHEGTITHEEVGCAGPGANVSHRVKWGIKLSSQELNSLLDINIFINQDHWLENLPISS